MARKIGTLEFDPKADPVAADEPRTAAGREWAKAMDCYHCTQKIIRIEDESWGDSVALREAYNAEAAERGTPRSLSDSEPPPATPPWDHPYESDAMSRSMTCIHCGWVGSYAHTAEFYQKWVFPALQPPQPALPSDAMQPATPKPPNG